MRTRWPSQSESDRRRASDLAGSQTAVQHQEEPGPVQYTHAAVQTVGRKAFLLNFMPGATGNCSRVHPSGMSCPWPDNRPTAACCRPACQRSFQEKEQVAQLLNSVLIVLGVISLRPVDAVHIGEPDVRGDVTDVLQVIAETAIQRSEPVKWLRDARMELMPPLDRPTLLDVADEAPYILYQPLRHGSGVMRPVYLLRLGWPVAAHSQELSKLKQALIETAPSARTGVTFPDTLPDTLQVMIRIDHPVGFVQVADGVACGYTVDVER